LPNGRETILAARESAQERGHPIGCRCIARIADICGDAVLLNRFGDVVLRSVDADAVTAKRVYAARDRRAAETADEVVDSGVVALAHHQLDQAPDRYGHRLPHRRIAQRTVSPRKLRRLDGDSVVEFELA